MATPPPGRRRSPPPLQIDPQFYAFRWITLLLSQEFPLPDVVRIWDTLLSDPAGRCAQGGGHARRRRRRRVAGRFRSADGRAAGSRLQGRGSPVHPHDPPRPPCRAAPRRMDCLLRVCLAMLLAVRAQLLAGDFAANVKLLQRYPSCDVDVLLRAAARLPPAGQSLGR